MKMHEFVNMSTSENKGEDLWQSMLSQPIKFMSFTVEFHGSPDELNKVLNLDPSATSVTSVTGQSTCPTWPAPEDGFEDQ